MKTRSIVHIACTLLTLAGVLLASSASAQGLGQGRGGGPPGVGEEETAGNNLSIPAVFVPNTDGGPALRVACGIYRIPGEDGALPSNVFLGYWLQKTDATWSADCIETGSVDQHSIDVTADWGDNLTTRPSVPAGKPVRVEVSLLDPSATGMNGFFVTNLTPELEDRLATYGTRGESLDGFETGAAGAPLTRVFDTDARLTIVRLDALGAPIETIFDGEMTAEINSIGAVVYGFNWGSKGKKNTPAPGVYKLTFTTVSTRIVHLSDEAALNTPVIELGGEATSIVIELTSGTGGGGPKGPKP